MQKNNADCSSGVKQRPLTVCTRVTPETISVSFLDVKMHEFPTFRCPAVYIRAMVRKSTNFEIHLSVIWGASQLCHTCYFLYWNAFWVLCAAELKSNKKCSVHLIEVANWMTLTSLHRLCVLLWAFFLLIQWYLFPGFRNVSDAPGFHQACSSMLFLPGCSSLILTSPLNYCVCAHGSVTLNPGFILLSGRRHRRHVCCSDIWQAMTLSALSVITVMK